MTVLHYWGHGGIRCGAPVDGPDTRTTSAAQSVTCPTCLAMLGAQIAPALGQTSPVLKDPFDECANCGHARRDHDVEAEGDFGGIGVCDALVDPENNGACGCPGFRSKRERVFNKAAHDAMVAAELVYMLANGWEQNKTKRDSWSNEMLGRYDVTQGHAVNIQKQRDRITLQYGEQNEQRKRRVREPAPERGLAGQEGEGNEGVQAIQEPEGSRDPRASDGEEGRLGAGHPEDDGADPGEGQPRS